MLTEHILTSFIVGIAATSSPCVLPLYPGYLAYLAAGNKKSGKAGFFLGVLVLFGVLTSALMFGLIVATASVAMADILSIVAPIANMLVILLGVVLLLNKNPFSKLAQLRVPVLSNPYSGSFTYGLLYGPIILPCSATLAVSVFALSFSASQFLEKLTLFMVFGLGLGIPLLAISFFAVTRQQWLARQLALRSTMLNRIAGLILIGVGAWGLLANWHYVAAYF
ncbi:MAG: hypothetical protein IBX68_00125 [Dehalococcoidia bacterium]|nr:hypothetical protein [Dehalococcoidia bacterium]